MITKQKTLLAKLVPFIFAINLNLLFASDIADLEENDAEMASSPFSVLNKDLYTTDDKDLLVVKQPINLGDMEVFNTAEIRLLEYNTGMSTNYTIKKNENWKYNDELHITLHNCWKAKEESFNAVDMALISVTNNENTIFKGWVFSKNSALSLPKIENHFLHLTACK